MSAVSAELSAPAAPQPDRILRLPEVSRRVGLSRSAIYRRIPDGGFPAPVDLGGGMVGWRESVINTWIAERPIAGAH